MHHKSNANGRDKKEKEIIPANLPESKQNTVVRLIQIENNECIDL
jgi:hypothetical protein